MIVTMNEVAHAIFTSGARSSDRSVASASAADCSGTQWQAPFEKFFFARVSAVREPFFRPRRWMIFTAALPPVSP